MGTHRTLTALRERLRAQPSERLAFAVDVASLEQAQRLIDALHAEVGLFKVGLELFTAAGPAAIAAVHARGRRTFLDLKLHDIPATVERAVAAAAESGVQYLTVHAAAGPSALQAAARACAGSSLHLLAVTLLTSTDAAVLDAIGLNGPIPDAVERLARPAIDNGIDGLVCAASECASLRALFGADVLLVTPGVRPLGADAQDQKRIATPSSALAAGADVLVVGRPIRDSADPRATAAGIVREIEQHAR